jgi:hypothetical protein
MLGTVIGFPLLRGSGEDGEERAKAVDNASKVERARKEASFLCMR